MQDAARQFHFQAESVGFFIYRTPPYRSAQPSGLDFLCKMTVLSVQKSKQPVGCTTQGCSAGGCSWPGPQTHTDTWVQHQLPCSLCPSPQRWARGWGQGELQRQLPPAAPHAAARVSEEDEVRITQQRAAPTSLLSHLKKPTGHVAKRLLWLPGFLGAAQPSSAMLGSRKQLAAVLSLKLHVNKAQSTRRVSDPPNSHHPHPRGCTNPSQPRVSSSVSGQPHQGSPRERRGRSPARECFQGGGVTAGDEDSQGVCSRERALGN